jgi:hypothetical protein
MEAPLRTFTGSSLFAAHGGGDLGSGGITSDVFKSLIHGDVT